MWLSRRLIYDALNWIAEELQLQNRPRIKKKIYRSELIVYAQRGLSGICQAMDGIAAILASKVEAPQELSAVIFGSSGNHSKFTFERRINEDFDLNVFFSSAGLPTTVHMEMLSQVERLIEPELHSESTEPPEHDIPRP